MPTTAPSLFFDQVDRFGDRAALRQYTAAGHAADEVLTWRGWGDSARAVAASLVTAGHRPGETAAVLAGNRLLWPVADLGIMAAGMTSVGIYPTSAPAQIQQVLSDSGASVVIVDTAERLEKVRSVLPQLPRLRTLVCQDAAAEEPIVIRWSDWIAAGARALAGSPDVAAEIGRRMEALRPESSAALIYTSGSTGEPKGACLSHQYLLASAASVRDTLNLSEKDTTLSFLPYCHAGERVFGLYTRVLCGIETALVDDHTQVWDAARTFGPTVFGGLPRFFEKVYESLQVEWECAGPEQKGRWARVLELGRNRSQLRQRGAAVPSELETEWRRLGEPLFERVHERFGGRLRLATSGGAALPTQVAETLDAVGVTALGAYGMTEHLCVSFYRPDCYAFDGVGPPMPGTELRIAGDGEVLVRRGPMTFSGYLHRPEDTRDAFTSEGEWLRTGDLGALDSRGVLRITGRKKELIALSTGKKVAPLPIEARLVENPLIAQAMLYGEGRKFISALLTLRLPVVEAWARERRVSATYPEVLHHPELAARVQRAVEQVNARLSRTEQIRRFMVLDRELSVEQDELTPTLKVRRSKVAEAFRGQLDALYR
jgi:long-chain acyl-CoA synthetase